MSAIDDVQPLLERDWSETLTQEIRRIRRYPAIEPDTVSISTDGERVFISFSVRTDQLSERSTIPILGIEPITLVYKSIDNVGLDAPGVWSGRDNFPRDIGHINPTPADDPVSLCLALAGLQSIYDRYGIDGVLDRLISWLHDAKTGQLMLDHWEPVPMGDGQDFRCGFYNIAYFQELALCHNSNGGSRFGVAKLLTEDLGNQIVFLSPEPDLANTNQLQAVRNQIVQQPIGEFGVRACIPWVFIWSDRNNPIDKQLFGVWNTYGEIETGLTDTNISDRLPTAIVDALLTLTGKETPRDTPVGLLVGVWRPKAIAETTFGVSENADARCLEIRAYLLHCEKNRHNPIDAAVPARQLVGIQLPSRAMLEFTSGISIRDSVALIGCGALGSCIGDFLARSGVSKMTVFDYDYIASHNLARHTATVPDLHTRKVDHLCSFVKSMSCLPDEIDCTASHQDFTKIKDNVFSDLMNSHKVIIDATASERVRRKLAACVAIKFCPHYTSGNISWRSARGAVRHWHRQ